MNTHQNLERMVIDDLRPDPRPILDQFAFDAQTSGLLYGFAHGSMLYKSEGSLTGTYKEIRVHEPSTEQITQLEFEPKFQPPDIDIVAVVEDRSIFAAYFNEFFNKNKLTEKLNYFFTLNVVEPDTLHEEITSALPRAIKRILKYRETWNFGDEQSVIAAKDTANQHIDVTDETFQREFVDRKAMLEARILGGARPFVMPAAEYRQMYPNFFNHLHDDAGGFPPERDKIVLPHSMDLKGKRYLGSLTTQALR